MSKEFLADNPVPSHRNRIARGMLVASLAASSLFGSACSGAENNGSEAPALTESAPDILNTLENLVRPDELVGPVATKWDACPSGGEELGDDLHVNALNFGNTAVEVNGHESGTTEIKDVFEYRNDDQEVIGWCGESIGEMPERRVTRGPAAGVITFIPAVSNCRLNRFDVQQPEGCETAPVLGSRLLTY